MYYETGLYIAYNCLANEIMFALIVCALHSFVYSLFECSVLFATCSLQIFTGVDSAYTRLLQDLYQSDLDWYICSAFQGYYLLISLPIQKIVMF